MRPARRGKGHYRLLVGAVVVALLSYTSTRCLDLADAGCPIVPSSHEHPEAPSDAHGSAADVGDHSHHHGSDARESEPTAGGHDAAPHTCCELTGKSAFAAGSPGPSTAPLVVLVTLVPERDGPESTVVAFGKSHPVPPLHGPPFYLRFATLLI